MCLFEAGKHIHRFKCLFAFLSAINKAEYLVYISWSWKLPKQAYSLRIENLLGHSSKIMLRFLPRTWKPLAINKGVAGVIFVHQVGVGGMFILQIPRENPLFRCHSAFPSSMNKTEYLASIITWSSKPPKKTPAWEAGGVLVTMESCRHFYQGPGRYGL